MESDDKVFFILSEVTRLDTRLEIVQPSELTTLAAAVQTCESMVVMMELEASKTN